MYFDSMYRNSWDSNGGGIDLFWSRLGHPLQVGGSPNWKNFFEVKNITTSPGWS